jgi:flagellar biosynthesis protein FlhF
MQLKSFSAKTVKEAMSMVKSSLGEDAIIVATREENNGKSVRVTAAIEKNDYIHEEFDENLYEDNVLAEDWFEADQIEDEHALIEKLTDVLLSHSVPEDITDQILSCATIIGLERIDFALKAALEHLFAFQPIPDQNKGSCYLLVGPPGAGKTLLTAKLAARNILEGKKASIITTDTIRAGGIEQLSAFTKILKINLERAVDAYELKDCIDSAQSKADNIYIDTGSVSPYDKNEIKELARLTAVTSLEPLLVMPAGLDPEESADLARAYSSLGIKYMIPTRLDFARRLGGILSAAHYGSLILAEASHTSQVANGIIPLSPGKLAEFLLPKHQRGNLGVNSSTLMSKQKEIVG